MPRSRHSLAHSISRRWDNIEVGHVGNGADGGIEALQLDHGVAQGVIVVDADVGEVEQVLAGGMAQLIIQRDVFLPVGGGNSDDLRAPLLACMTASMVAALVPRL